MKKQENLKSPLQIDRISKKEDFLSVQDKGNQEAAIPLLDARETNTFTFEEIWAQNGRLKQRFQYNLEAARKDFLYVLQVLNIRRENQRILDVGFGNGMLAFLFKPSCMIHGTEFSKTAISAAVQRAQRRGYRDFSFVTPSISERLPFASKEFDLVIASHVIEHVVHDVDFLREMIRVLKPSGYLIVLMPLDNRSGGLLSENQLINPAYRDARHFHVRNYNMETLLDRLSGLGGQIVLKMSDMHIWDWKTTLDHRRGRLVTHPLGKVVDRSIAAIINIPLAVIPRRGLVWLDRLFAAWGYRARQAIVVVEKAQSSLD